MLGLDETLNEFLNIKKSSINNIPEDFYNFLCLFIKIQITATINEKKKEYPIENGVGRARSFSLLRASAVHAAASLGLDSCRSSLRTTHAVLRRHQ